MAKDEMPAEIARLLVCAFAGEMSAWAPKACRKLIRVAEAFATGKATAKQLRAAQRAAQKEEPQWSEHPQSGPACRVAVMAGEEEPDPAAALEVAKKAGFEIREKEIKDCVRLQQVLIDPAWLEADDGAVRRLVHSIDDDGKWFEMPLLVTALRKAGCADAKLLKHLGRAVHWKGCWAVTALANASR